MAPYLCPEPFSWKTIEPASLQLEWGIRCSAGNKGARGLVQEMLDAQACSLPRSVGSFIRSLIHSLIVSFMQHRLSSYHVTVTVLKQITNGNHLLKWFLTKTDNKCANHLTSLRDACQEETQGKEMRAVWGGRCCLRQAPPAGLSEEQTFE